MTSMKGKTALITGATSGIGLETSVELARMGARVVMIGRNRDKTAEKVKEVQRQSGASTVESLLCDFSSQAQIRKLAADVRAGYDRLQILVNNAGTVFAKRKLTEDGIESTFAVDHLGYFLFTNLLLDLLVKSAPARIVNVTSVAHYRGTLDFEDLGFERGYKIMRAYARAKLGNVLFTRELAKRLAGTGVTVNCVHPGAVATNIWSGAPGWIRPVLTVFKHLTMLTPAQGAQPILYLATSEEVEGKTGLYFQRHRPTTPSALALDEGLAKRLWEKSTQLVKIAA